MASSYSARLRLELITDGEKTGTWGQTTNTNIGTLIEEAIAGKASVLFSTDANVTLTANDGASDQARCPILDCTSSGSLTATRDVIVPAVTKLYIVYNRTTGSQSVRVKTSGGTGITVPNGSKMYVYCDGTNVVDAITGLPAGTLIGGASPYFLGGTDVAVSDGGTGASSASGARTNLGLVIGTDVQAYSAALGLYSAITPSSNVQTLLGSTDYAAFRSNLSLGALALLGSVNDSNWSGTDLAVANGGTGASTAANARTNLGVVIGTDVQAYSGKLAALAASSDVSGTITVSTSTPSGGSSGDIWLEREA